MGDVKEDKIIQGGTKEDSDIEEEPERLQYKVILLGDGTVGKTSIATRFAQDDFSQTYKQTIGLDFFVKRITLPGDVQVALQIWDIGGQSIGSKMMSKYIFGAHAVVMCYDITNYDSFQNLDDWYRLVVRTFANEEMPYVAMVGNKCDLSHLRAVRTSSAHRFADDNSMYTFFMSAKSGDQVDACFHRIAGHLSGIALSRSQLEAAGGIIKGTILRGMKKGDVDGVVALAFTEYYEGPTEFSTGITEGFGLLKSTWERALANGKFEEVDVEKLTDWLEMIWLRIMIRWGFGMRISIGQRGQDHRVFCVADEEREDGDGLGLPLAAVAEVSLQVPNGRTATPFPLPLWVKQFMAWPGPILPYISNVLVHPHARRQGYANRLMLRCEEQARDWGFSQVYLHVDWTYYPAVRMYETMGYEVVNDLEVSFETPRLRYMKKIL
eukprot:g18373.t1